MRIVLVTDSLGLPRYGVDVEDVWTEKLLQSIKEIDQHAVVYPVLLRLLTIRQVWNMRAEIGRLRPDIVIFQFGVVDCSRRVLPYSLSQALSKLPQKMSDRIRNFLSKHHYYFTKLYCIRYNDPEKFAMYLRMLVDWMEQRPRSYAFIRIAPPGEALKKAVFDIESDIAKYNTLLKTAISKQGSFLDPYGNHPADEIVLQEDGHHLNPKGAQIVYECVYGYICEKTGQQAIHSSP